MRAGGVILMPTDTIWGLACDATQDEAVQRVFALKGRPSSKALITLVDRPEMVSRYVRHVPDAAWDLMDVAVSPLTLVYDKAFGLSSYLYAPNGSVAIRVTEEPFSKALCRRMNRAIVSTSANLSGEPSPKCFKEISSQLLKAVDYVCASRHHDAPTGKASGIIKIGEGGEVKIIR